MDTVDPNLEVHSILEGKIKGKWECLTDLSEDADMLVPMDPPLNGTNAMLASVLGRVPTDSDGEIDGWSVGQGIPLNSVVSPIKGLPADISTLGGKWARDYSFCEQFSTLNLAEVITHDWVKGVRMEGYSTLDKYWLYLTQMTSGLCHDHHIQPETTPSYVAEPNRDFSVISVEEANKALSKITSSGFWDTLGTQKERSTTLAAYRLHGKTPLVSVTWYTPVYVLCPQIWGQMVPLMFAEARRSKLSFNEIRAVFCFG